MSDTRYRDRLVTHVQIRWGLLDRLRILLRGTSTVRVTVQTEHEIGHTESASDAWAAPIFTRRAQTGLYLEATKEP